MSAAKNPHHADRARWLEWVRYWLALFCVGVIVHWLTLLLPPSFTQRVNAVAWDVLMRNEARADLWNQKGSDQSGMGPADPWNQFVFIDVDDSTCEKWTTPDHSGSAPFGCSMSSVTPRNKLAGVIKAISSPKESQDKPALVVLDIDLAPVSGVSESDNTALCRSVVELARQVPIIVVRPTAINLARRTVDGHTSIFDFGQTRDCAAGSEASGQNLWFGSSLVWNDFDHVVRRVGTRDQVTIVDAADNPLGNTVIGSVGLLGGTLLRGIDKEILACWFPGSAPPSVHALGPPCSKDANSGPAKELAAILMTKLSEPSQRRILFSVPTWWGPDRKGKNYPYVPNLLCHISASNFSDRPQGQPPSPSAYDFCGRQHALSGAVVVIGGSYTASGDLRTTPLNSDVPGAVIHINAIRAFAEVLGSKPDQQSHWVPKESSGLGLIEVGLIAGTALLGLVIHELADSLARGRRPVGKAFIMLVVSLEGVIVQVVVIFAITMLLGVTLLPAGKLVEVLMPPLVIAFEGSGNVFYLLHGLIEAIIDPGFVWLGRIVSAVRLGRNRQVISIQASHLELRIETEEE